jgi:hypothetical protein
VLVDGSFHDLLVGRRDIIEESEEKKILAVAV